MLKVFAMCGIAFSGKSTLARQIADTLSLPLISLDDINHERGLHGGEGMIVAQWEETSSIAMVRLRQLLNAGRSAVVDDTFSQRFLRDRCKFVADEFGARFAIVFVDTPISEIRRRRMRNDESPTRHAIRDSVFEAHVAGFQFPTDDEPMVHVVPDFDIGAWLRSEQDAI